MKKRLLKEYWDGFVALVYPRICLSCGTPLVRGEDYACSVCMYQVRRTAYHLEKENPVAQLFYGRVDLVFATSYFGFDKGGVFQKMMHGLKYKGHKEVGEMLGKHLGLGLQESPHLPPLDVIVPVPLHKKREKERGYNQSEFIALGIASVMEVEVNARVLVRTVYARSQTRLSREERRSNVAHSFALKTGDRLCHKHVLLVDDVLTTGATLEACYDVLKQIEGIKISVATLARASS